MRNPTYFLINDLLNKTLDTLPLYQRIQLSVILAKDVLPIFEEKFPNDNRPRLAIEAAESWLADPSEENATAAWAAAAAWAARTSAYAADAAWSAGCAAGWAAGWAAKAAANAAGWAAKAVDYNAKSKFYKIIPNKQQFIKTLGKSK